MSQPDLIGKLFGNYRLEERLGMGGMGTVYRARHLHLDRFAAVKILHVHLATDPSFLARFHQEARAVSMLDHPNVVRLIDFGDADGELYLVMELLTDGSLRTLLHDQASPASTWSPDVGIDLVRQAGDGLAYAHGRGMVHRDIKPDNLLLLSTPGAERPYLCKLADFGLARLGEGGGMMASGVTLGTPAYMSPEQCQGGPIDRRSDIYSLGVVLYEVTAGRPPFRMRTLSDAIYNHVYVAPPPPRLFRPSLSLAMERVILRCLAKHPGDRYQSMAEFTASLDQAIASSPLLPSLPIEATQPTTGDDSSPILSAADARTPTPVSSTTPELPNVAAPRVDPSGSQVPRIIVFGPTGDAIETADLTGAGLTVGRLADNLLVLDDPRVSRHHLLIDWDGSGAHVTDIGSSTGTHIGGTRVPAHVSHQWNADQTLRIGGLQLRLVLPAVTVARQGHHDPEAHTGQSHIPLEARSTTNGRRRWLVTVGVAVLVFMIGAALYFSRDGNDDSEVGAATSTMQIASSSDAQMTQTSESTSGDAGTQAALASVTDPPSTDNTTIVDPSSTVTLPTAVPTPETPEGWITVTTADPLVGPLIGQPVADAAVARLPFQAFERGIIISVPPDIAGGGVT